MDLCVRRLREMCIGDGDQPMFSRLDIRVGKIIKSWNNLNADGLYVELIDLGEETPRQVCLCLL